jgi:hypothetical protein
VGGDAQTLLRATWHRNIPVAEGIFRDSGVRFAVSGRREAGVALRAPLRSRGMLFFQFRRPRDGNFPRKVRDSSSR